MRPERHANRRAARPTPTAADYSATSARPPGYPAWPLPTVRLPTAAILSRLVDAGRARWFRGRASPSAAAAPPSSTTCQREATRFRFVSHHRFRPSHSSRHAAQRLALHLRREAQRSGVRCKRVLGGINGLPNIGCFVSLRNMRCDLWLIFFE